MVTTSEAEAPLPSLTRTDTGTGPSIIGAVHGVCRADALVSDPAGAFHVYVSASPSGSCASAATVVALPRYTVHGSQRARTVGGRFCTAGGAGGGAGGGGA